MSVCEDGISTDVPALEFAAVLLLAPLVQLPDNGRSSEILALETVLSLTFFTDPDHSDIVTLDMTRADETYNLGTCKPAVCQHITEAHFLPDAPANHLDGEINLAHEVLCKTSLDGCVLISFWFCVNFILD